MDEIDFWLVQIEHGLGPIKLGMSRDQTLKSLDTHSFSNGCKPQGSNLQLQLPELGIRLVFSEELSEPLRRIDIEDPRVRFGTWDVIGKPIHKVIRLFKCADDETLWCNFFKETDQLDCETTPDALSKRKQPSNPEQMRFGTLWIPSLGLGFSLNEGRIKILRVCAPNHAPKFGTGTWNGIHKTMSETGIIPKRTMTTRNHHGTDGLF